MPYTIVGLGNPGNEYEKTRHNTGRLVLEAVRKKFGGDFEYDKKNNALVSEGRIGKEKVHFMAPETFMNNSGKAVSAAVKSAKAAERLVVIYDDFNLPLGRMKISFNRSSGGHNGVESIIKSLGTEKFIRIRVGTAPETAKGTAKVPHGDDKIEKFILGRFKDDEMKELTRISKKTVEAVEMIVKDGREKAMSVFNAA